MGFDVTSADGTRLRAWTNDAEGPTVLLVHGWGGRSTDLARLVVTRAYAGTYLEGALLAHPGFDLTLATPTEDATVNAALKACGLSAPVLRANHTFRAIPVPPGDHVVTLRYGADSLRGAALVSLAVLLLLVLVYVVDTWRSRRPLNTRPA